MQPRKKVSEPQVSDLTARSAVGRPLRGVTRCAARAWRRRAVIALALRAGTFRSEIGNRRPQVGSRAARKRDETQMSMSDAEFANEMIGRTLIDPAGTTYVVIDFRLNARHGALYGRLVELVGGEPTGTVREIDSIAGWMVGNRICTCQGY